MTDEIFMRFSPESRLSDIRALLDSYAVELWKDGLLYRRCPIHSCDMYEGQGMLKEFSLPAIDYRIDVRMCTFEPPAKDFLAGIRERRTRWPFFVEYPLSIVFWVADQWWQYGFTPGKQYEDRRMEYEQATRPPF